MKRSIAVLGSLLVLALLVLPAAASAASWTGFITDEACGAKGGSAAHAACAKKCADKGSKMVFFNESDKKLYKLDDQKQAKQYAGDEVKLSGSVDGDKITVEKIEKVGS